MNVAMNVAMKTRTERAHLGKDTSFHRDDCARAFEAPLVTLSKRIDFSPAARSHRAPTLGALIKRPIVYGGMQPAERSPGALSRTCPRLGRLF